MKAALRLSTFLTAGSLALLSIGLSINSADSQEFAPQRQTEHGYMHDFSHASEIGTQQGYLDRNTVPNSLDLLSPPPLPGSAAFAHDEEVARASFALRDTTRFALAVSDYDLKLTSVIGDFSCALDAEITEQNAPYLMTLLRRSFSDIKMSTSSAKAYYQRKRPFQVNQAPMGVPEDRPKLERDGSYPSGHTAIGWGFSLILSEIAPARADEILSRGQAFGESRIVVNHHWYSDTVGGRLMGAAAVARLHGNPAFRADLEGARAEFAAIRAKATPLARDCIAEADALAKGFQVNDVNHIR